MNGYRQGLIHRIPRKIPQKFLPSYFPFTDQMWIYSDYSVRLQVTCVKVRNQISGQVNRTVSLLTDRGWILR